jgi:solute carrier family 35, member E3
MSSESGRSERAGSIASSHTETGGYDDHNEKVARDDESLAALKSPIYHDSDHEREDEELLPPAQEKPEPPKGSMASSIVWMVVNTLATIGIVSRTSSPEHRRSASQVKDKNPI